MNGRLASSVEELASIIKEYAKKHKKLSDRVQELGRNKSPIRTIATANHNKSNHSPPVLDNSSKTRINKSKLNTSRDNSTK